MHLDPLNALYTLSGVCVCDPSACPAAACCHHHLQAKTEFMQLWDGMEGARGSRVLVMGATNRPWMVDEAVLRRFALQYEIGLPSAAERVAILRRYLLRHEADMALLRRHQQLQEGAGGVDLDLLLNRWVVWGWGLVYPT